MNIFDRFRSGQLIAQDAIIGVSAPRTNGRIGIRSPWITGELTPLPWYDIFEEAPSIVTREQALTVPSVYKARATLLSLIADQPLILMRGDTRIDPQPWLYRTPVGKGGRWQRIAWTLDDLFFYGWSLWEVTRGAPDSTGRRPIIDAWRVPWDAWQFDDDGVVNVFDMSTGEWVPADASDVILIPGPDGLGLLGYMSRTIRGAVELERSWVRAAANPIPAIDLHETIESSIEPAEAQEIVDDWAKARTGPNGAIAYTPYQIEARALGQMSPDLYVEGRGAIRLDIANFFNLPAAILDGSPSTASLTYSTSEGKYNEVLVYSIPYWARCIEDRLSQDDIVAAGLSVHFDFAALTETPQPPVIPLED